MAPGPADDVETVMARNREFHLLIGRSSGNRRLAEVIERLVWESDRFFFYQFQSGFPMQRVPVEHRRLAEVLRTRDPAEARRLAASEASETADNLLRLIVSSDDRRPWPVTAQHGNEQAWKTTSSTS